jgi:Niemann-Pick C1 protein
MVTTRQPINAGLRDWKFFNFEPMYFMWEFYSIAGTCTLYSLPWTFYHYLFHDAHSQPLFIVCISVEELILSTVLGIAAVVFISILFIPHWSGALFVAGMVCVLYVDLLGVLQLAGIAINSVTYVGLVMSIGLMVDYIMHITVVYFESCAPTREEKVRDVLMTIGTSVFIGGTTTLLGVVPLAFSTSEVFWNMFVLFLGLVTLGMGHGLILMPVLLSLIGPVSNTNLKPTIKSKSQDSEDLELSA